MTFERLLLAGLATLQDPRKGARAVIEQGFDMRASWTGLLLISIVSALLSSVTVLALTGEAAVPALLLQPFALAAVQFVALAIAALLVFVIGRQFGGTGSLADATALIVWFEVVFTAIQVLQVLISLALPTLGISFGLFTVLIFFWVLCHFIAELHGFQAIWKVLLGVLASGFAVSLILALILIVLQSAGIITGAGPTNA